MVGASASPEAVAAKSHELGYDRPLPQRFADYLGRTVTGDLQSSLRTRNPVSEDLRTFAPASLELALAASVLAAVMGIALALALAAGGRIARVLRVALVAGASVPGVLIALVAILVFYSLLGVLPASGRVTDTLVLPDGPTQLLLVDSVLAGDPGVFVSALAHLVLPAFTLALVPAL